MAAIKQAFEDSCGRYGVRNIWHQLRRNGHDIARCTVERLMKAMGLQGVVRGKRVITTNPDAAQPCPDDKVNRAFVADMPNQIWVSDFTYVSSWQGMVYVAFVIDVFARKIVGWRASTSMTTGFVRDALNQVICQRTPSEADKLIHHSDQSVDPIHRVTGRGRHRPRQAASVTPMTTLWLRRSAITGLARTVSFICSRPRHQTPRPLEIRGSGRVGKPEMGRLV
ncbi:MAG: IS3 family transposase [Paracoccus sp. (in: a-proteobacteria)]